MEGLIPFVYKAIMQYKNGKEGPISSWLCESPSYSYMKLAGGDSGRFQTSASSLFGSDNNYGFSVSSSPSSKPANQIIVSSSGVQSPRRRLNSHSRVST
ncbi:hypothetical protein SESBI_37817 [Sesbania bispinosa]|nr:hypothetical protein SESBI_37817 [Sesbania bispinosa]